MTDNLPAPINWESELKGAAMLIKSRLVPKDIQTPEAAMFVILAGRDLGLSPVQSLRSIRPIQGKIECSADLQLGLFHRDGGKSRWLKLDAQGAELELSASWLTKPHVSRFGVEEAKRAELMSNANYRKYPQAMFRSRAITQGLKDIGFLTGAGVYAPGELGGGIVVDEASGEVLPSEEQPAAVTKEISGTAGSVENLDDDRRDALMSTAELLSVFVENKDVESAFNLWHPLENDAKVAVWAMLGKSVRKAIKAADTAAKERDSKPNQGPSDDDLEALIDGGDFDAAKDLVRGRDDEAKWLLAIDKAQKQTA